MVFYTDVFGISAAVVGVLFLVARLWDAVADVAWGRFIDTRKANPRGKFKPWILRMSLPLVVSGVLMFIQIPGMSNGFYLAYAFVTYILWGTLYSTVNIPYGSMASVITSDPVERTSLSTYRTMGSSLACYIACYNLSTERVIVPESAEEKTKLSKTLKGLVKNKPLLWILIASLVFYGMLFAY